MNRTPNRNERSFRSSRPRTGVGAGAGKAAASGAGRPGARRTGPVRTAPARPAEFTVPEPINPGLPPVNEFAELQLPPAMLETLAAEGVTTPFPIQAATLPNSLAGRDVLGRGRTGSGKTLAFGLALLARTAGRRAEPKQPLGLVLVPTRELAQQVTDALTPYAKPLRLRLATVVGGLSIGRQAAALRGGTEIVIATPGRLKDLIQRGDCRLDRVGITVLDEADQMADMGFMPQITQLLDQVRPGGQRMLFSATLDRNVDLLVRSYLEDPIVHSVDPSAGAVTTMEHHVLHVHGPDKFATATEIAARDGQVIMFLDTKRAVDRFTKDLLASGVRAGALHGGKSQPQRTRTLEQFKSGHVTTLVATNVAARGIHVDDLDLVVNVDPPTDHKDYLHRGGRTARAGASGIVVTLVLPEQRRDMIQLMRHAGITPQTTQVRSGEAELTRITGAQRPSGIPVTITAPVAEPAQRAAGSGSGRPRRKPSSVARGQQSQAQQGQRQGSGFGRGQGGGRGAGQGGRAGGAGQGSGSGRGAGQGSRAGGTGRRFGTRGQA